MSADRDELRRRAAERFPHLSADMVDALVDTAIRSGREDVVLAPPSRTAPARRAPRRARPSPHTGAASGPAP